MKIKDSKLTLSITHRILAMEFISEFIVIYPFYAIMFGKRGGVSAAGISLILTAWQITTVIAEVPTGIIADKFSKKWVLLAAKLLRVMALTSWLVLPSFTGYLLGFVLWGIGDALNSGAFQAYLYESLSAPNKNKFGSLYARVNTMTALAVMGAFAVSFLLGPQYNLLLALSVLACLVAAYLAATLPAGVRIVAEEKPRILSSAVRHIFRTVSLRELLVGAILIGCLSTVLIEYMALYYTQSGVTLRILPLLLIAGNIIGATLYWHMAKLEDFAERYRLALVIFISLLFVLSFHAGKAGIILGYLLLVRVIRFVLVHYESVMQHLAKDETRATIGSLYSFSARLLAAGLFVIVGLLAENNDIVHPVRYVVIGTVAVFILSQVLLAHRKKLRKAGERA